MGLFFINISSNDGYLSEKENDICLLLEKVRSDIKNASHINTFFTKTIITDARLHKVKCVFPENGWNLVELTEETLYHSGPVKKSCDSSSNGDILLPDCLHEVADSLPYTGAILRVTLFDNISNSCDEKQFDHYIPLAGALRRLREWHNGQVVLVSNTKKLFGFKEHLVDLGHCQIVQSLEQMTFKIPKWEGKIAVVDRIENKGPTFTGLCIESDIWETLLQHKVQACFYDVSSFNNLGKKQRFSLDVHSSQPVGGRTIEILQEVDLRTFPLLLADSWTLSLNEQEGHSNVLMKYIQELQQVGLLARLRVYSDFRNIPCCGKTNSLNTEAWKKRILENSCEEPPEKSVTNDVFYLYLLLLKPANPGLLTSAAVRVVLSPREINKNVIDLVTKQTQHGCHSLKLNQADLNMNTNVFQSEAFVKLLKFLQEIKKNTITEIQDCSKRSSTSDAERTRQEILNSASQIQEKIIASAFQGQPTFFEFMQQENIFGPKKSLSWIAESSLSYEQFPEKMALQAKVTKKTELQSYPSQDSLFSYSPLSVVEIEEKKCRTDFAINDILQMFNKDGTPVAPPFTPEKVEGRNLCRVDSTPDLNTQWPNSQSLQYHDIYYYMDENDLGLEKKYSKIRDKILEQDTLSTFVTPTKKKTQKVPTISPIRSSPRRQNSAQHLMTRSRSESGQSNHSPASFKQSIRKNVFKQPSPSPRRLSTHMISPGNNLSSSLSCGKATISSSHYFISQPVLHSTPLSSLPTRMSPRKRALNRSFSSASVKSLPQVMTSSSSSFHQAFQKKLHPPQQSQKALHRSLSETQSDFSILAKQSVSDPPVRRSPRKAEGATLNSSKHKGLQILEDEDSNPQALTLCNKKNIGVPRTASVIDIDENSQQSQSELQQSKMKRSDRHKMKLKNIIKSVLEEKGVKETSTIYAACFKNLFNVSIVLLKALTSSQNLTEEMKNVVYTQVQQIINLEKRRCGITL